jgi:hypothetical protein
VEGFTGKISNLSAGQVEPIVVEHNSESVFPWLQTVARRTFEYLVKFPRAPVVVRILNIIILWIIEQPLSKAMMIVVTIISIIGSVLIIKSI